MLKKFFVYQTLSISVLLAALDDHFLKILFFQHVVVSSIHAALLVILEMWEASWLEQERWSIQVTSLGFLSLIHWKTKHIFIYQVMEQCVARLDVAMFNAILRESDDEMPTDPVSDPVSDPKVLPVPSGKSSFGAGIQLKNAVSCTVALLSCTIFLNFAVTSSLLCLSQ